jgi:hypothetical protein
MRIAWYLGFGWPSIATAILCGVGINLFGGWIAWVLYFPFLAVALYMSVRLRLFSTQPWRRVHSRAMTGYARLAAREYDAAKVAAREFDVVTPCRQLAETMLASVPATEVDAMLGAGRSAWYDDLVEHCPQVFVEGIKPDLADEAIKRVHADIATSRLGPDIVIARAIERKHGKLDAARYLHALLVGKVR